MFELDPALISSTASLTVVDQRPIGSFVPLGETYIVPSSKLVVLREVPADNSTIAVTGTSVATAGPFTASPVPSPPGEGEYSVNFTTGVLEFHINDVTSQPTVNYEGTGSGVSARDINNITAFLDDSFSTTLKYPEVADATAENNLVAAFTDAVDRGRAWFRADTRQFRGWDGTETSGGQDGIVTLS